MPRKHPNNPVGIQPYPATANLCPKTLCPIIKKIDESPTRFSESLLDKYRELNNKFAVLKSNFYDKGYEQILANYYNGIIENEELLKEAMRYLEEILTVTEQMAQISNESLFALKTDSIIDLYQIRDWYNEMYNLSAKYSLAETYCQLGLFEEGFNTLALITEKYNLNEDEMIEHNNYVSLFTFKNGIRESGRTIAQLNEAEIEQMLYFAKASHGLSSVMARGILCFLYDICLEEAEPLSSKAPLVAEEEKGESNGEGINLRKSVTSASSACKKTALENITLVPNPTTGELRITNYELRIENIEIYDVYGRKTHSFTPSLPHSFTNINISHLNPGIYFIRIQANEEVVVRKIIKI